MSRRAAHPRRPASPKPGRTKGKKRPRRPRGRDSPPPGSAAAVPESPPAPQVSAPPRESSRGVLDLIREVQSGAVDPRNIGHEDRRACVGYLTAEGYAASEIAQILKTSDRTIHRDRERLRADHALQPSDELVGAMAGQLVSEAFTAIGRLRRLGRDKDAPHAARVEAEKAAWLVMKEMVQSLQRLGYLPLAVPSIKADFTHRMGAPELAEVGALQAELERLIEIKNSTGSGPPELESGIKEVQSVLLRLEAGQRLHELNHSVQSTEAHNESQHHP